MTLNPSRPCTEIIQKGASVSVLNKSRACFHKPIFYRTTQNYFFDILPLSEATFELNNWHPSLPMLRQPSFKAQGPKDFRKPSHDGTHWKALTEYPQMSTTGFSHFSGFFSSFCISHIHFSAYISINFLSGTKISFGHACIYLRPNLKILFPPFFKNFDNASFMQ